MNLSSMVRRVFSSHNPILVVGLIDGVLAFLGSLFGIAAITGARNVLSTQWHAWFNLGAVAKLAAIVAGVAFVLSLLCTNFVQRRAYMVRSARRSFVASIGLACIICVAMLIWGWVSSSQFNLLDITNTTILVAPLAFIGGCRIFGFKDRRNVNGMLKEGKSEQATFITWMIEATRGLPPE